MRKELSEWVYSFKCLIAYLLGHAAPPDRKDMVEDATKWGCSLIHGMDKALQSEGEILSAIEEYSEYGSSIERKNLNIKYLLGIIRRLKQ